MMLLFGIRDPSPKDRVAAVHAAEYTMPKEVGWWGCTG